MTIAYTIFIPNNKSNHKIFVGFAKISGIASSLVAIYTAINAPIEIEPFVNKSVDTIENPHCGTLPSNEPKIGLNLPFKNLFSLKFVERLYSNNSIR